MRRSLTLVFGLAIAGSSSVAIATEPLLEPPSKARAASVTIGSEPTPGPSLGFEWASVFEPGKSVAAGDYTRTIRPFLDWTQICDGVRNGRRICYLETTSRGDVALLGWRIALSKDGRAMALIMLPQDSSAAAGVTVTFSAVTRVVKPLICDRALCVATFPTDGVLIPTLGREDRATIAFERSGTPITVTVSLRGLTLALADLSKLATAVVRARTPAVKRAVRTPLTGTIAHTATDAGPWKNIR